VFKSAFVALVGRPSSGKSTLLNTLCGAKVSIVSPVPQTTRNSIRGIVTEKRGQLVFIDTPGVHLSEKKMNRRLRAAAEQGLAGADLTLYLIDATRKPGAEEQLVSDVIQKSAWQENLIIAVNKTDAAPADCATIEEFVFSTFNGFDRTRLIMLSALTGSGTDALLDALFDRAHEGPQYYDGDCYTDQEIPFRIAEIIREKCIVHLREELPHCIHVIVEDAELRGGGAVGKLWVRASILTERESQKGMVVGKGGSMIRKIRIAALQELKKIFEWKIELDLRVKSAPDWRQRDEILSSFV
jgi:GTP-binding protein Era